MMTGKMTSKQESKSEFKIYEIRLSKTYLQPGRKKKYHDDSRKERQGNKLGLKDLFEQRSPKTQEKIEKEREIRRKDVSLTLDSTPRLPRNRRRKRLY